MIGAPLAPKRDEIMKAMNLYLLSRAAGNEHFSLLARELTGGRGYKHYSRHEADSLRALTDALAPFLREKTRGSMSWISVLDGFYFSYTIAHISKEFDLLKISGDGNCVLNIELKSEAITEDRVLKQLSQNRYYLSHISRTIFSYTFVMETNTLYVLNDKGHMRVCEMSDLADVLLKPAFMTYVEENLDQWFRASDYLISPAAMPEKFLQGSYFLTNQQAEFKRRILELVKEDASRESQQRIAVSGGPGTGKTLLLYDLALALSKKKKVLLIHGLRLQQGHNVINERLRNVEICTAEQMDIEKDCAYVLVDEADRIPDKTLDLIFDFASSKNVPCIMAFDPYILTGMEDTMMKAQEKVMGFCPVLLEFTGNIRINRPVISFLRTLFYAKDRPAEVDYSCIDVLCANKKEEALPILDYYKNKGYHKVTLPGGDGAIGEGMSEDEVVGLEVDRVIAILDSRFYYDGDNHLCADGEVGTESLKLLYEGISATREKLCLIVMDNEELFGKIIEIRERLNPI